MGKLDCMIYILWALYYKLRLAEANAKAIEKKPSSSFKTERKPDNNIIHLSRHEMEDKIFARMHQPKLQREINGHKKLLQGQWEARTHCHNLFWAKSYPSSGHKLSSPTDPDPDSLNPDSSDRQTHKWDIWQFFNFTKKN